MEVHKRFIAKKYYNRLDHFLNECLEDMSRTQIARLIKDGRVKMNDRAAKKNNEVMEGEAVDMTFPVEEKIEYKPTFQLKKLFEDEYIIVIDKPIGVSVHMGAGKWQETILDVFTYYYPQVREIEDQERPGIVHRLDKDTSGVMILAKDIRSQRRLQKQFKRREVSKTYLALASGRMRYRNGTIDEPLIRSPNNRTRFVTTNWDNEAAEHAREAVTDYSVIKEYDGFSYVKLMPRTGRTHQLRVHLSHMGAPILGDRVYGKVETFERLALHAYSIEFVHPITDQIIKAYSPFPTVFRNVLKSGLLQAG
ncbi:MAG: RluA family pseudouridine synthase [bacterium]|nr:RluA family pseudouridine synthase [bacterium]